MLRHSFENFLNLCKNHFAFFVLTSLCLIFAFVSFLYLQEKGYYSYHETVQQVAEARVLYVAADSDDAIKNSYDSVASDALLPSIEIATMSNADCSGLYWNTDINANVWYTPYGRFFTLSEMTNGSNVIMLGNSYIKGLSHEQIDYLWENSIDFYGHQFEPIANYSDWGNYPFDEETFQSEALPTSRTIPLKTFIDLKIPASKLRIVFSKDITAGQANRLWKILNTYENVSYILPTTTNETALKNYAAVTMQYSLILVLSLISITSVVMYWIRSEYKRYNIYIICGAQRRHIVFLLCMNIVYLITFAFCAAHLITHMLTLLTPYGIVQALPLRFYSVIYIGILITMLSLVIIRSVPILFSRKISQ